MKDNLVIFTGTRKKLTETLKNITGITTLQTSLLNDISTGYFTGLTSEQIKKDYPQDFSDWEKNPFKFRYPQGESYEDVVRRLESFLIEIESITAPVLVVGSTAVIQVLYAYFGNINTADSPFIQIPFHTVIEFISNLNGWDEKHYDLC